MERCRVYYKEEGVGFPQVWAVVSLVCPWLVLAPKMLQLRTKHLVWVFCRPVWVSEACQLFLVPSWSSSTPLYPSKCCELGSVPRLLLLSLFSTWTHIWIFQGVGSALTKMWKTITSQNVQGNYTKRNPIYQFFEILIIGIRNVNNLQTKLKIMDGVFLWNSTSRNLSPLSWIVLN